MKKVVSVVLLVALVAIGVFSLSRVASADEGKLVGVITKIDIAGKDAKIATATLKNNDDGKLIDIVIKDDETLDKFKDHRIVEGDEIRCKYEVIDGKNVSKYFKKTAGC